MNDNNLIFLISQPRSGSSMLQQVLNSNPNIISLPEPWFMLPLIYTYKFPGVESDYNSSYANICFNDYLQHFDKGLDFFKICIKDLALKMYSLAFDNLNCKKYFLDKTPRYYHIIDELFDLFRSAKFVILVRNPLSVFASILDYNFNGDFVEMLGSRDRICDLLIAPKKILEAKEGRSENIVFIKYEDLVKNPHIELQKIYKYLSLEPSSSMTNYSIDKAFKNTTSIDTKSIHKHSHPVTAYLYSWKKSIDTSQKKRLAREYMYILGKNTTEKLGYSYENILNNLSSHKVRFSLKTKSFCSLVKNRMPIATNCYPKAGIFKKQYKSLNA